MQYGKLICIGNFWDICQTNIFDEHNPTTFSRVSTRDKDKGTVINNVLQKSWEDFNA